MDVYVETLRNDRDSGSDVETPTVKTVEADLAKTVHSTTDALSPAKSAEVEVERTLGSSTSASSASTNASFDFKAHRSFRASNPFALDTGLGGWSGSERGSSPAGTSIDERNDDDDDSMLGPSSSGSSQARSIPPRFVLAHDEEDEDDHRRAEWESRLELDEPELTIGSSGTPSVSFSASNSMSSINSYLSESGESIRDVTITSKPSKEAQGTFGRSTSTGLASQLRAKLVVAPPHSLQAKKGWDTPSPIPSPTPSDAPAPARPPMRRIDSERKAAKIKQEMAKEVKASQSQPVPLRPAAQASKYASVPLDKDQENSKTCLLPASQPASTNHTLSDIYSNYRGKLGSSRSEQDHEPDHKDEQVNTKNLMARRSQSLSYSHSQGSAFSAEGNNFPSFATSSFADSTGSLPTSRSRILEQGYRSGGVQAQDSSLGTDPSSTSGSLLSCLSSNSESEPVLMTPHLSGRAYAAHCTSDIAPQIQTSSDDLAASQVLYARKDEATQTVRVEPKQEETSIGATAIARRRRAFTLRGEMSADLSKASNPVPIRFYIGDAGEPSPSPRHDRAVTSPEVRSATDRESLPSVPSTPFFPKTSKDAPGTSFTRMEVPLPLHNSPSTQSMMQAYDGVDVEISNNEEQFSNGRETISPMLQIRNSVRKRSLSLKRSQPQLRVDTNVAPSPVPLARVKSERCASPSAGRGSLPLPIPTNHGGQSARSKLSVAGSLPEASPISSKDYFKTERYNDTQFTMNNETDNRNWQQVQAEETDEWGFIGNSPVPAIYATQRADPKLTAKVEQNILAIITKPLNSGSVKKIRKIMWEQTVPPSLRCRVWNWLQPSSAATRGGPATYRAIADQVVVPVRKDQDLPLFKQFGTHRAIINGTFPIQEMSHVYACRHPKTSLAFDTTWIAAIFASQAFDTEQAYWLYESLMNRLAGEFKPIAIRVTSVILPQLLAQQDQQLHADLLRKGFDSASYGALLVSWLPSIFASALPFPTILRLMDLLILEGPLLLLRAALAILLVMSKRLISAKGKDDILRLLLQPSADELVSPESLVKVMAKISLSDKVVEGLKTKALASLANQRRT